MRLVGKTVQILLIIALVVVPPTLYLCGIGQLYTELSDKTFQRVATAGKCPAGVNSTGEYPCTVKEYIDKRVFGGWATIGRFMVSFGIWIPASVVWLLLFHQASEEARRPAPANTRFYDGRSSGPLPPP